MDRRTKIKVASIVLVSLLLFIILIVTAIEIRNDEKIEKLKGEYDTRLSDYKSNEAIALKYLSIISVSNQEQYDALKTSLYTYLSGELQKEIFDDLGDNKVDKVPVTYEIIDVKVEKVQNIYTYLVEYKVKNGEYSKKFITLISVENGKIMAVETL